MVAVMMTATDAAAAAAAAAAVNHFKQKLLFGHFSIKKAEPHLYKLKPKKKQQNLCVFSFGLTQKITFFSAIFPFAFLSISLPRFLVFSFSPNSNRIGC